MGVVPAPLNKVVLSAIPLLEVYPKKMKLLSQRDIYAPMFVAALLTIAEVWKQLSVDGRQDKENVIYTYK